MHNMHNMRFSHLNVEKYHQKALPESLSQALPVGGWLIAVRLA